MAWEMTQFGKLHAARNYAAYDCIWKYVPWRKQCFASDFHNSHFVEAGKILLGKMTWKYDGKHIKFFLVYKRFAS